jgi:Zn-dependent protease
MHAEAEVRPEQKKPRDEATMSGTSTDCYTETWMANQSERPLLDDEVLYQKVYGQLLNPDKRPDSKIAFYRSKYPLKFFIISSLLFILLSLLIVNSVTELLWLILILLLHETGHYLAMSYFGYRNLRMFFIPLFGAAVSGEKKGAPAWQEAIVLLLGPIPGLLLGCIIYFIDLAAPQPLLRMGASWLVWINFINLMPMEPLDGGRFCNRLLFSRNYLTDATSGIVGSVAMLLLFFGINWISAPLLLIYLWKNAPFYYKRATATMVVQSSWPNLPVQIADLSDEQLRGLFKVTRLKFGNNNLAEMIEYVHERAVQRPESSTMTLRLLAVFLAAILLTIATAFMTNLGEDTGRRLFELRKHIIWD